MRVLTLAIAASLLLGAPAFAKSLGELLPAGSAYSKVATTPAAQSRPFAQRS